MDKTEINKRLKELAHLKIHPREQSENKLLLLRAEKLYEQTLGERRQYIAEIISEFEILLGKQDLYVIDKARIKFLQQIKEIEQDLSRLF